MVARAIFHSPAVLFLDEPTAGLDPQSRLALWDMLQELNASGQTVVLTTHYMEEADQLCARVAIMDHGRILALDTPANLKKSVGADTIVTVKVASNGDKLAEALKSGLPGVVGTRVVDNVVTAQVEGESWYRASSISPRKRTSTSSTSPWPSDARDGLHQSHGQGVARSMTTTTARFETVPMRSVFDASHRPRSADAA